MRCLFIWRVIMFNIVHCDNCEGVIFPKQVEIKDEPLKPGIQIRYWKCPICNHRHLIMVLDKKSRRMIEENKKDRIKIDNINKRAAVLKESNRFTDKQAQSFLSQVEKLNERIDKRTVELDNHSKNLLRKYEALT